MLVIRFLRVGKKNQPSFKIVVTDKRRPPRGGRFVEELGFYNPLKKEKVLREERIKHWLSVGAKPSDTVYNLLVKEGIIEGKKISVHKKPKKEKPAEEKPITEEKPKEKEVLEKKEEKVEKKVEEKKEPASTAAPAGKEKLVEEKPTAEAPKEEKKE